MSPALSWDCLRRKIHLVYTFVIRYVHQEAAIKSTTLMSLPFLLTQMKLKQILISSRPQTYPFPFLGYLHRNNR